MFIFGTNFAIKNFKSSDFMCDKSFLKFQSKFTQARHFCPKFKDFLFSLKTLALEKLERADLKYDDGFFLKLPPKFTQI